VARHSKNPRLSSQVAWKSPVNWNQSAPSRSPRNMDVVNVFRLERYVTAHLMSNETAAAAAAIAPCMAIWRTGTWARPGTDFHLSH